MSVRNLVVNYAPAATVSDVLNALLDAFTSTGAFAGVGLGFTQLEDSIAGDSLFVVQAQQPTESLSRMIIEVRHVNITAVDYIAFVVWNSWTPGAPGTGGSSVQLTDPSFSNTTGTVQRFHKIDLTNGGDFYLDGDDATGLYLAVHSDSNAVRNVLNHFVTVCSIERSFAEGNLGVNYGVIAFADSATAQYLQATTITEHMMWIPPENHVGSTSNSVFASVTNDRAVYMCQMPLFNHVLQPSETYVTGRGNQADTYNGGELVWPLFIGNMGTRRNGNNPAPTGTAYGFRGITQGVFGYSQGAAIGRRSTVVDDTTGKSFLAYPADNQDGNVVPTFLIEKA